MLHPIQIDTMHFRFKPRRNPASQSQHRSVNRTAVRRRISAHACPTNSPVDRFRPRRGKRCASPSRSSCSPRRGSCTSWSAASGGPSRNAACAGAGSSDSSTAWIQTSQQSCPAHASQGAHPFRQPKSGQPLVATAALRRDPPARGERHEEPEPGRKQGGGWMSGRASPPLATTDPRGDGMMQTVTAPGASARTTIAVQSMV